MGEGEGDPHGRAKAWHDQSREGAQLDSREEECGDREGLRRRTGGKDAEVAESPLEVDQ